MSERRTLTRVYAERYRRACKKEKGIILDEFLSVTQYHRCYAGWLLRKQGQRVKLSPQRGCKAK